MEYVIANVGYFFELWMIQLYAELVWKRKFCFRGFSCILFVINGLILTGINVELIPGFFVLFIHIMLHVYLWVRYGNGIKENIARSCIAFVLAWGTEVVSGVFFYFVGSAIGDYTISLVLINCIALFLSICIRVIVIRKRIVILKKRYHTVTEIILICAIPLSVVLIIYFVDHEFKVWYNLLAVFYIFVVIICLERILKKEYDMQQKEIELNINRVYGGLYEDFINDIRRKQHNYKDQIAAIYSVHKTVHSLEELIGRQKEYCDILLEDSKYDFILTSCHEPILAGFIYHKCLYGLSKDVVVNCRLSINEWYSQLKLYEFIEVLGIFFNNAFEYVINNNRVDKIIFLSLVESEDYYSMSISNEVAGDYKIDFTKLFEIGYSTKGDGRGLGLSRARQICTNYGVDIKVQIERDEKSIIIFEINISKEEK